MSRRPSVASLSSIGSGLMKPISLPTVSEFGSRPTLSLSNGSLGVPSRSTSFNTSLEVIVERSPDSWDPDALFTKHTVAQVKAIQQRLRGDADAKQEELRLMVGERYRDLLQASTSIISIAQSSDNVLTALNEVRGAMLSIRPTESAQASTGWQGDEHLQDLQSLAAHLKLLLDAPEHLWRFMERKLYLHAAWLFLLSRVVHRSLLRGEDEDDATWHTLGIHISEQFPIVQRQWEAVSHFRSQISHKATMALREQNASPPEVCAILLTLHLLESRPLPETLATFLAQRTRSLNSALNRAKDRAMNGSATDFSSAQSGKNTKSRKVVIREVRQKLKAVAEIVVRTMGISRHIFIQESNDNRPLMHEVLQHIQGDDKTSEKALPIEVRLTSQTLLTSLPSSNHFLLLPASIKSYKPYIDGTPLLAGAQGAQFKHKLEDWFQKAVQSIRSAMDVWFAELSTIRDLWEIRRWCKAWLQSSNGLDTREVGEFGTVIDSVCRDLAAKIWKNTMNATESAFRERLASIVKTIGLNPSAKPADAYPVQYLFQAPAVPSVLHGTNATSSADVSFQTFRDSLEQQLTGRTPLLDDIVSNLERQTKDLRQDLDVTQEESGSKGSDLTSRLLEDYIHDTEVLRSALAGALQAELDGLGDDSDILAAVFLGRVAHHISSSHTFLENMYCTPEAKKEFQAHLTTVFERSLELWQDHIVSKTIKTHWSTAITSHKSEDSVDVPSARPSATLLDSLLAISSAIQTLGVGISCIELSGVTRNLLHRFVVALLRHLDVGEARESSIHTSWDLAFLFLLMESWGPTADETKTMLHANLAWHKQSTWPSKVRDSLLESLSRSQISLGLLLPPDILPLASTTEQNKPSSLLQLGMPVVDAQYQSAFNLVKPSSRFGLLLVGSSVTR